MTTEQQLRSAVIAEALTWAKTPYHHRGNIKGVGVDCAQFLIEVYSSLGICDHLDVGHYSHDWHLHHADEIYLRWIATQCDETDNPQPGDIALFRFGRCVSHSAIIIDWPGQLIHSFVRIGVTISSADDAELREREGKRRIHSFWTPKGYRGK